MKGIAVVVLVLLIAGAVAAGAPDHRHHVAISAGGTWHEKGNQHGGAYAIEYEYRLHEYVGVGAVFDVTSGIKDDPMVLAVSAIVHPAGGLKLIAGAGYEFKRKEDPLVRVGVGYDFHLGEHLTLGPVVTADFVSWETNINYTLALGWGF